MRYPAVVLLMLLVCSSCGSVPHPPGSYFATLEGQQVHYQDHATQRGALPLVLVHGGIADHRFWRYNVPGLTEHRRVIVVDLPGHGRSGIPEEYSMDVFADAIATVMDHAGVERAVVVGQSNGVPTIRQFYRRYPERTAALVCVDGGLREDIPQERLDAIIAGLQSEEYKKVIRSLVQPALDTSTLLTPEQRGFVKDVVLSQPQETAVGDLSARKDRSIWDDDSIDVPALVIHADVPRWTQDYQAYVDGLVTGRPYEFQRWEGVSHLLFMEKPEKFAQETLRFVRAVELGSGSSTTR